MEVLESKDWVKVCEALNDVRRLVIHHSSLLQSAFLWAVSVLGSKFVIKIVVNLNRFFFCVGSRDRVLLVLTKSMKSPRSALCKSSIMASSDVFHHFGQLLLSSPSSDAFDQLVIKRAPSPIFFWGVPICNDRIQSCIDLCSCCDSCWRRLRTRSLCARKQRRLLRQWPPTSPLSPCWASSPPMSTTPTSKSGPKPPFPSQAAFPTWSVCTVYILHIKAKTFAKM